MTLPRLALTSLIKDRLAGPRMTKLQAQLASMLEYGTAGYPPEVRRRLKILNVVCYLIIFFTFLYVIEHFGVDYDLWKPVIWINLFLLAAAASVPFMHRYSEIAGGLMIAVAELIAQFVFMAYLGRASGMHIQYIAIAASPFVILGLQRKKLIALIVMSALILHITSWFMFPGNVDIVRASRDQLDTLYISAAVTTFAIVSAIIYYAFSLAEQAQAKTDHLLRNILPESVVDRLKERPGEPIADSVESATVLFSDLKGFVPTSKALGPERTVALLNDLMKAFDKLAAIHGVEKIKTIGDAYMVASGVPEPVDDHASRMCAMACSMMGALDEISKLHKTKLVMRIGIASGPLMAGVIGAKRLTYDVWGDTVNLAARLESSSLPGKIQVSKTVVDCLGECFALVPRGSVEIKGVGPVKTWFVAPAPPPKTKRKRRKKRSKARTR